MYFAARMVWRYCLRFCPPFFSPNWLYCVDDYSRKKMTEQHLFNKNNLAQTTSCLAWTRCMTTHTFAVWFAWGLGVLQGGANRRFLESGKCFFFSSFRCPTRLVVQTVMDCKSWTSPHLSFILNDHCLAVKSDRLRSQILKKKKNGPLSRSL